MDSFILVIAISVLILVAICIMPNKGIIYVCKVEIKIPHILHIVITKKEKRSNETGKNHLNAKT